MHHPNIAFVHKLRQYSWKVGKAPLVWIMLVVTEVLGAFSMIPWESHFAITDRVVVSKHDPES